ncbi:MAG: M24 family metallopeptidase, partial [Oscillospiraceae bacterium]|nr:M24 family metallopeptidase [Oscillospiraceae bacterium]
DASARKIISDAGYGAYFGHGYGHGLGLQVHEAPNPNGGNPNPMPIGAVCSAEPGIYLPGKFGVRIEDVVIITEDGIENLTKSPKDLIIL